jgi:hypothetical protein
MARYRIIQIDTTTNYITHTQYAIQKRFLFWWMSINLRYCVSESMNYVYVYTDKTYYDLNTVKVYLNIIMSPFKKDKKYKGRKLLPAIYNKFNTGNRVVWVCNVRYDYLNTDLCAYAYTVEGLKRVIDQETPTEKVTKKVIVRQGTI